MMTKATAAYYAGLSLAAFDREVAKGELPLPIALGGRELWSKVALDQALERLAGEGADDWRKGSRLYANG